MRGRGWIGQRVVRMFQGIGDQVGAQPVPEAPPPPPFALPRTNRTSLVPPLVLSGHAAS